ISQSVARQDFGGNTLPPGHFIQGRFELRIERDHHCLSPLKYPDYPANPSACRGRPSALASCSPDAWECRPSGPPLRARLVPAPRWLRQELVRREPRAGQRLGQAELHERRGAVVVRFLPGFMALAALGGDAANLRDVGGVLRPLAQIEAINAPLRQVHGADAL